MANRKLTLFLTLTVVVSVSVVAHAQGTLTLGPTSMQWTFMGIGSSSQIELMPCNDKGCGGNATGTGIFPSGNQRYSFSPLGTLTLTLTNAALGEWDISGPAINFFYGPSPTGKNDLLTGTLNLLNLEEAPGSKTGEFNYSGSANLVVTGGSLASLLGQSAVLDVSMVFNSDINLENLLGTNASRWAHVTSGSLTAAPEPASILLLGSGMLGMGSMLRFRARKKRPSNPAV